MEMTFLLCVLFYGISLYNIVISSSSFRALLIAKQLSVLLDVYSLNGLILSSQYKFISHVSRRLSRSLVPKQILSITFNSWK